MGIPWYFYTIYKKYNNENELMINETAIQSLNVDYLFLDYNSMIHPCAQQTLQCFDNDNGNFNLDDEIIKNCLNYTRYLINVIKAKNIYIMIDGVAPRAKINQQRERRYKTHFFKSLEESGSSIPYWNSNKITPGTLFMNKLTNALKKFVNDMSQGSSPFLIKVSDSNECGEGEHKMMKIINELTFKDEKICIYGLDADLIMLSLINKFSDNIILIRDNTFNTKLNESERTYTYLNCKRLKDSIIKDLRKTNENLPNDEILILDYIFLCFLLGNDFLEHIPSLMIKESGMNVLLKYYNLALNKVGKDYKSLIIDKTSINLDMLQDIFYNLAKSEEYFYNNIYSVYKNPNKQIYRDKFDLNLNNQTNKKIYFYTNDIIKFNEKGFKERYYNFYGIDDINLACKDYLDGLYWILGYYNNHSHNNWSWFYNHHSTPFASDIFQYIVKLKIKSRSTQKVILFNKKTIPMTSLEQLFMVLPKDSLLEIIKEQNLELYGKLKRYFNCQEMEKYYPSKICLEMIHKEYLWQAKVFLNTFDKELIKFLTN